MNDRKQPGMAFWATVVVVGLLIAYPLSFGPACWITSRTSLPGDWLLVVYRPMIWALESGLETGSGILFDVIFWYSMLGSSKNWGWITDGSGHVLTFGLAA
jgi:hypothetical protein